MTDIFETTSNTPTMDQYVGEGKKYADLDAAAKALAEKDAFIARLQDEARRKEADLQTALNTKAFEDRMAALEAAQGERGAPTPPPQAIPAQPAIDEEAIKRVFDERERSQTRSRNLMAVQEKLTELFGPEYPHRVKARAAELGIAIGKLNELAAETPNAFYAMLGLTTERKPVDGAPPATRQNTAGFTPQSSQKNNAYYSNMRKTDPSKYWTPAIQMEEYNELKRQGPEKFYGP